MLVALAAGIPALAAQQFSFHMLQHVLLTTVGTPLVLLGAPVRPLIQGLPASVRHGLLRPLARSRLAHAALHVLRHPLVALALYTATLYVWHWPPLYDGAVADGRLHVVQHASYVLTALLFWSVVIDPEPFRGTLPYGVRILYVVLTGAAQNTVLGGVLSLSTVLFYRSYAETTARLGLDPLTDQRTGGAVMWVLGDVIFLIAASASFFLWLEMEERQQLSLERRQAERARQRKS